MKKHLIDTHVILWFLEGKKQLPNEIKDFIIKNNDKVIVSSISL